MRGGSVARKGHGSVGKRLWCEGGCGLGAKRLSGAAAEVTPYLVGVAQANAHDCLRRRSSGATRDHVSEHTTQRNLQGGGLVEEGEERRLR